MLPSTFWWLRRAFSLVADVLHNDPQVIVFIVGSEVHHYVSVVAFDARGSESECACICMCVRVTSREKGRVTLRQLCSLRQLH